MKVLIVSFYYEPEIGAAPSRITNLAKGLKAKGVDVDVLTCLPNYPQGRIFDGYRNHFSYRENIDGIDIYRYWTYATVSKNPIKRVIAMFSFAMTMWAFALRRKNIKQYDRVIIQSPPIVVSASAILLFRKLYKRNVVLNVSDLWPSSAVELGFMKKGSLSFKYTAMLERFIYKNATSIMGQSQEIIEHINRFVPEKPMFLYRNLANNQSLLDSASAICHAREPFKIVYAGLLGVAQDICSLIKSVNFELLGVEMHLYGAGNQVESIKEYIASGVKNIFYHGTLSRQEMDKTLLEYDASIVALVTPIYGAVPSKIFDLLPAGVPILFCGGGEGARIVSENSFGLVSASADYKALEENIISMKSMSEEDYSNLSNNCVKASRGKFSFSEQMDSFIKFLQK